MADVKWIKLATEIFDNRKIKQIECLPDGDGVIVIWFKLLCLAGNINDNGMVYFTKDIPYTDQMLAAQFNRPITLIQLALETFMKFGMVEIVDDILHVSNWEKYQNVDRLNELREYNRIAKQRSRERKKLPEHVNDMSMTCQSSQDTDIDKDIDKDKEKDIDKTRKDTDSTDSANPTNANNDDLVSKLREKYDVPAEKKTRKAFSPPSVDEVKSYCTERNNSVDAEKFVDYYSSNGWMVGKNKMKDWKAAVRTWEKNQYGNQKKTSSENDTSKFKNYTEDELPF